MLAAANWRQALHFFQAAEDLHAWQLRETQLGPYLALEGVPRQPEQTQPYPDHVALAPALLDYHICYSHSYQVPILCFRAMSIDGEALGLQALLQLFPAWPSDSERLWSFVMPQEHPLLPGPCWFSLHPCNSGTVLALTLGLSAASAQPASAGGEGPAGETGTAPGLAAVAADNGGGVAAGAAKAGAAVAPAVAEEPKAADLGSGGGVERGTCFDAGGSARSLSSSEQALGGGFGGTAGSEAEVWGAARSDASHYCFAAAAEGGLEDFPDMDTLLAPSSPLRGKGSGLGVQMAGASCEVAPEREPGVEAEAMVTVGPAGVRWPGGAVPQCPDDPRSLRRYMAAWFSLVAPQVGLRAPNSRR